MINEQKLQISSLETVELTRRPRRNRKSAAIRELVQETRLHPSYFVSPLFLMDGENKKHEIKGMPGVFRLSIDLALKECIELYQVGVRGVDLFTLVADDKKDARGSEAIRVGNLLQRATKAIKSEIPELCVMVDVALDPFTDHGHDGVIDNEGNILNDETLAVLGVMSALAADAGADIIAPSDMMDGRVGYIRRLLDRHDFSHVSILSYAVKYASSFYGPFRNALNSAPKFGDKKTYQMNPANFREAMLECSLDEWEGADMLMVKPALPYLDILTKIREASDLPLAAYHVSGEYAMIMAAAQNGWVDADRVLMESMLSIKRAGANFILTYGAKRAAELSR